MRKPRPLLRLAIGINRVLMPFLNQADFTQQPPASEIVGMVTENLPACLLGAGVLFPAIMLPRDDHVPVRHGIRSWSIENLSLARRERAQTGPGRADTETCSSRAPAFMQAQRRPCGVIVSKSPGSINGESTRRTRRTRHAGKPRSPCQTAGPLATASDWTRCCPRPGSVARGRGTLDFQNRRPSLASVPHFPPLPRTNLPRCQSLSRFRVQALTGRDPLNADVLDSSGRGKAVRQTET